MKEWWNGPSFFWSGAEDGSGQHFWGGRLEWKAFHKIRMVPQSDSGLAMEKMCRMGRKCDVFLPDVSVSFGG